MSPACVTTAHQPAPAVTACAAAPEPIPLAITYEDAHLIVAHKPAGVVNRKTGVERQSVPQGGDIGCRRPNFECVAWLSPAHGQSVTTTSAPASGSLALSSASS